MSIVSNQLFDTHKVLVFKIPPGEVTLPRWDTKEQNVVWKGNLRLIEEEETIEDEIEKEPYELLRLKLEFYNADKADPLLDNIEGFDKSQVWAEAWFNPFREQGIDWAIANDKDDTIKMTQNLRNITKLFFSYRARDTILFHSRWLRRNNRFFKLHWD